MKNNAVILNHLGMGDMLSISPAIRLFASKYKEVFIVSKFKYYNNVMKLYEDIDNINVFSLTSNSDNNQYTEMSEINSFISDIGVDYDLHSCGIYKKNHHPFDNLPDNFYYDLDIPLKTYDEYFKLHEKYYDISRVSNISKIIENYEYIFVSGNTSLKDYTDDIFSKIKTNYLILSTSKNFYDNSDERYEIANSVIDLPLFDYIPLIQNCKEAHVIGGVFSILSKFVIGESSLKFLHNCNECILSKNFFSEWEII